MVSKKAAKKKEATEKQASSHTHRVHVERAILKRRLDADAIEGSVSNNDASIAVDSTGVQVFEEATIVEEAEEEIQGKRYNIRKQPKPSTKANTGWRKQIMNFMKIS